MKQYFGHTIVTLFTNYRETASYWIRLLIGNNYIQAHIPIKEAETAYWAAHFMVPSRQKARYKLALMYYQQKRISEANRLANEVLTEKVKVYGFETYEMHRELRRIFEDQLQ